MSGFRPPPQSGLTPLHLAAQEDKVNVAEILVNHGAALDPETKVKPLVSLVSSLAAP